MNKVAAYNLVWVRYPMTWLIIPGWADTTWSIDIMALGLVSKVFLVDPIECFPLALHGLLWDFPNIKGKQGVSFLILMRLIGIIPLLDSLMMYFKEQWFSLWCQTMIYLSSRPRSYLVGHSLTMSSLVSSSPISYLSTS